MSQRPRPPLPDEAFARNGIPLSSPDQASSQAADAVRDVIDILVAKDVPEEVLKTEAKIIFDSAERMRAASPEGKRARSVPNYDGHPQDFFPNGPTAGWANPLALPIAIWGVDGVDGGFPEIRGQATFSLAYEGPPTCVHGGVISLMFDELLGDANLIANAPGMTASLSIRYRRPTPLMTPLTLEARTVSIDGRKITAWGAILNDGEITAEAEGLFIAVEPEQMMGFALKHAANTEHEVIDPNMAQAIADSISDE